MKIKINIFNQEKSLIDFFNYKKDKITSKNIYFTYQFNTHTTILVIYLKYLTQDLSNN